MSYQVIVDNGKHEIKGRSVDVKSAVKREEMDKVRVCVCVYMCVRVCVCVLCKHDIRGRSVDLKSAVGRE